MTKREFLNLIEDAPDDAMIYVEVPDYGTSDTIEVTTSGPQYPQIIITIVDYE